MAQTLSRICRFWGQTSDFYSVAQHCLVMESLFEDLEMKRWAMGHEVFEALTGMDIPSPIKHSPAMQSYCEAEDRALEIFAIVKTMIGNPLLNHTSYQSSVVQWI